ncbi:MAG: cell envelope integrity protein CreD [Gammaproteobacteria bacterium]
MNFKLYTKVGLIIVLALLLMIPLGMISVVVYERSDYRNQVVNEIERTWTGTQTVAGPVLSIPYWIDVTETKVNKKTDARESYTKRHMRTLYHVAQNLTITSHAETQTRSRGIYSVPVYTSTHRIVGEFDFSELKLIETQTPGFVSWGQPELSLLVSDIRGISGTPTLKWNRKDYSFVAGSAVPNFNAGVHADVTIPKDTARVPVELTLDLRGSQELSFIPLAEDLTARVSSTWPHPKFDGQFLPADRDIDADGFTANWRMSSFATDARSKLVDCAKGRECHGVNQLSFGVKFFEPVDIYVKVTRAIKYGALFIVLTFVAFFLTETLTRSRLHPLQYALVGLSLAVFYLLLVSLSEHLSFATAYVVATLACAGLIGVYLKGALGQNRLAITFTVGIGLLYAMLFSILRSEDFALLMGSLLLFAMLALVMILTRQIDWYAFGSGNTSEEAESST